MVVVNKIDLLPYVDFDLDRFAHDVGTRQPAGRHHHLSATRGDGLDEWLRWLVDTKHCVCIR